MFPWNGQYVDEGFLCHQIVKVSIVGSFVTSSNDQSIKNTALYMCMKCWVTLSLWFLIASLMSSLNWLEVTTSLAFCCWFYATSLAKFSPSSLRLRCCFWFEVAGFSPVSVVIVYIIKAICSSFSFMLIAKLSTLFARMETYSSNDIKLIIITIIIIELVFEVELCWGDEEK